MEKKGIVSERCELNRQIRADNALLRELKAAVRKLTQAVRNTVPVLAETMEKLRENMIIFRYQLRHIGVGKRRMDRHIQAVKPELERYADLARQIRGKSKERKDLLTEKKATPFYQAPKLHDLNRRIAGLTEELEELKSEKDVLLHVLDCAGDEGISAVRSDISAMENTLKKLAEQEIKYAAELDNALKQYAELKAQAAEPEGLKAAQLMLRPDRERSAIRRVQTAYGEKYDPLLLYDSKRDIAALLGEEPEARSVAERLRREPQPERQPKKVKQHEQER